MRREGRQRGWVCVYDRELVDPEGKRRAVHVVEGQVVANGGFIRASRKPTNQSKSGGRRALGVLGRKTTAEVPLLALAAHFGYYSRYEVAVQEEAQAHPPAAAHSRGKTSCKASSKFRHHEKNMYYLDEDELDYLYDNDS